MMKKKTVALSLVVITFFISSINLFASSSQPVNSILADKSFHSRFGYSPDGFSGENLRIKTHLEYVYELLKNKNVSYLPPELFSQRMLLLEFLHEYLQAEIFPHNYDHNDQRVPCFIDRDGRICAVGYLIEKTSGRQTAEQINSEHKYDLIMEMNDEAVNTWIRTSGLTEEECAMIQPSYGYDYENAVSSSDIAISTTLTAANLTLNALNAVSISNGGLNNAVPFVGFITGTAQVIFGAVSLPEKKSYDYVNKDGAKVLSAANIGIGASTIILSIVGLFIDEKKNERKVAAKNDKQKTSWNIYSLPVKDDMQVGVSFTRKF